MNYFSSNEMLFFLTYQDETTKSQNIKYYSIRTKLVPKLPLTLKDALD